MLKMKLSNILTTIQTLSEYAGDSCTEWIPDDNSNFDAEAIFFVISSMAEEAQKLILADQVITNV